MFKRSLALALLATAAVAAPASASVGYGALEPFSFAQYMWPSDVAVEHGDGVYMADGQFDKVYKSTLDGELEWTSEGIDGASSVGVHDGVVYVLEAQTRRVLKLDAETGATLGSFGGPGSAGDDTKLARAVKLDVAANGDVYVLDDDDHRVKRFASDGTPLGAFGGHGTGPGQFTHGSGLAIDDARGVIYVVDYHQRRVQKLGLDGTFKLQWTTPAYSSPHDPAVTAEGDVLVPDIDHGVIRRYSAGGQAWPVLYGAQGSATGQLDFPFAVAADQVDDPATPVDNERFWVADTGNHRISPFGWYDTDDPVVEIASPGDGSTWPAGVELWPAWSCSDDMEPLSCVAEYEGTTIEPGDNLHPQPGTHAFTVRATDPFGNTTEVTHTFTVEAPAAPDPWPWGGFYAPIDNGVVNTAKAGSAIPVKFSLGGERGLDVFEDGYPRSVRIPCDTTADHDAIEQTDAAGASTLTYDPATDRYHYVWKTAKSWSAEPAGPCRQLVVKLRDGSEHRGNFRFR